MKTNSLLKIVAMVAIIVFTGCSTNKIPNTVRWNPKIMEKVVADIEKTQVIITENIGDTITKVKLDKILDRGAKNPDIKPESYKETVQLGEELYKQNQILHKGFVDVNNSLNEYRKKVNPKAIKILIDSLIVIKLRERKISNKLIPTRVQNAIAKEVSSEVDAYLQKVNQEVLKSNEVVFELVRTKNTQAVMLIQIIANTNIVESMLLNSEHNNFFEIGSNKLSEPNLNRMKNELTNVLNSMLYKIDQLRKEYEIKNELTVKIIFEVDGYTDSTPFKDNSAKKNKNLSQERADHVGEEIEKLTSDYFSKIKIPSLTFLSPKIISIGHGEELPYNYSKYKMNDPERRMIKITWKFAFN